MAEIILFVCTGNTCRSPMAEGLARHLLAEISVKKDCDEEGGEELLWSVMSAGVACYGGGPAAREAVHALETRGIDISEHRSQSLTKEMVEQATVIYGMAQHHVEAILDFEPGAAEKTHLLDPDGTDIADPIGMGQGVYDETAARLEELIRIRLAEITKEKTAKGRS